MRTIIDIPKTQIETLDHLSKKHQISRAELIRRALESYIQLYNKQQSGSQKAFGIWNKRAIDSLDYERQVRNEWDS
jgi:metal-responsive CopG/Arc/MetJ family transcriptional regulator